MKRNNNTAAPCSKITQINQVENTEHIQLGGQAFYDELNFFMFAPDDPVPERVTRYRGHGIAQRLSDGTFDFVPKPKPHPQSKLIRKLAHGRVSLSKDNAIYLTLKIYCDEGINISDAINREAFEAAEGVKEFQLKR